MTKITPNEAEEWSGAVSDVLCWLRGFQAAHCGREDQPEMPPNWRALRDLNLRLKKIAGCE